MFWFMVNRLVSVHLNILSGFAAHPIKTSYGCRQHSDLIYEYTRRIFKIKL